MAATSYRRPQRQDGNRGRVRVDHRARLGLSPGTLVPGHPLPELLSRRRVRELAQGEDKHIYDYFTVVERDAASQPIAKPRPEYENRPLVVEVARPWTLTTGHD